MSEKDKMLHQKLYNANYDQELERERIRCKILCQQYNSLSIDSIDERHEFIKSILGETGKNVHIEPDFWCDYGYRIKVGGGSVVVKDIPSDSVAAGNPCKVIRKIKDDDANKNWDR